MNFLLRSTQPVVLEQANTQNSAAESRSASKVPSTLEGLISEDPFPKLEDASKDNGVGGRSSVTGGSSAKNRVPVVGNHSDVPEDKGWITIPSKELPDSWSEAPDILSLRSLDRSFVFPGEQVRILACLSASKKDVEIITPFKVAAVMSKNGMVGHHINQQTESTGNDSVSVADGGDGDVMHPSATSPKTDQNGDTQSTRESIDAKPDISASASLLRMEDHKKQTETQLERFKNSHFFVRISESDEPLWSKRSNQEEFSSATSNSVRDKFTSTEANAYIDRGSFDANVSGGVARDAVKCCSLSNGDIVMLLQVNVGTYCLKDPILEVLQFEKYQDKRRGIANVKADANQNDPCRELLKWLLPLDRALPPPVRPLSPPSLSSSSIGSASQKSSVSASSGSQLFSFGNFRSYSMSALPPNNTPPPPVTTPSPRPNIDLDDWSRFSQKSLNNSEAGNAGLLSFRGVSLEPDRFSVHCGLEGIYIPGRRWRKKLEIVQPVEIRSFAAECNTEDLLCVQIKNVSPPHIPDIVVYLDAIAIVFEEAPKGGPPISLPITCVEAGNDYSLPNLTLRRNEEHSFILKPATSMWRSPKANSERVLQQSHSKSRGAAPNLHLSSKTIEGKSASNADQYAVLVSCRCNYTESRLFFKQPTSWRPRFTRDLMISVASEMSEQALRASGGLTQLPVQVLTLQASNLTSEDLTLTVLAPASFTSPPSVVSLNSAPATPMSPFVGFSEFAGRVSGERRGSGVQRLSSMPHVSENKKEKAGGARSVSFDDQTVSVSDVVPASGLGCTHLWLQSAVPLGCVPSQSTATVKLELLPLTDGIITLDTLQINVKEKGLTYIPEHSLKIYATSSIATGIV